MEAKMILLALLLTGNLISFKYSIIQQLEVKIKFNKSMPNTFLNVKAVVSSLIRFGGFNLEVGFYFVWLDVIVTK